MPNLETNVPQKCKQPDTEFSVLPMVSEPNVEENCSSDLDNEIHPVQSIRVKGDSFNGVQVQSRGSNNFEDDVLMDKLLLVQRKLSYSKQCSSVFRIIFQNLNSSLDRLTGLLEEHAKHKYEFSAVYQTRTHLAFKSPACL
ncbi:hypothetical protein FGIG_08239 [Fasciola gigantica]|uniref:Uncharacterized protein n=1 Tax=Fasciola gigantica TaxID=46835 RepID=A0A504YC77_FASGI|nr:hypothetical protein FGIG_08239 [Fasciola gigantica]